MTPGSVKVVRSKELIVKKYRTAPTIGMAGFMLSARKGQLGKRNQEKYIISLTMFPSLWLWQHLDSTQLFQPME